MYTDIRQWSRIRHRVLVAKESIRHVAFDEALARGTVKKILKTELPPVYRRNVDHARLPISPFLDRLRQYAHARTTESNRRILTAASIHKEFVQDGFTGTYKMTLHHLNRLEREQDEAQGTTCWQLALKLNDRKAANLLRVLINSHDQAGIREGILRRLLQAATGMSPVPQDTDKKAKLQKDWKIWLATVTKQEAPPSNISPEQHQQLKSAVASGRPRHRLKSLAVLARYSDFKIAQIGQMTGLSRNTVRSYMSAFESCGYEGLMSRKQERGRLADSPDVKKALFEILHEPPSLSGFNRTTWRMVDLRSAMSRKGFNVGADTIRSIIRAAGYRWKCAKVVLTSTDPQYREKLAHIQNILSGLGPTERFFSIDEFGPFAVKAKPGRVLAAPGVSPSVPQWQKSKGCLILTAALELSKNQVTHFYSKAKNTKEMIRMADQLLEQYSTSTKLYLSWDAASWHISKALTKHIDEHNASAQKASLPTIELAPLPASAQFLNVIESVFSGMARAIIHSSDYESVDTAKDAIDRYFRERNAHFQEHPKKAGNKIWGKEIVLPGFSASNNCKDPAYR